MTTDSQPDALSKAPSSRHASDFRSLKLLDLHGEEQRNAPIPLGPPGSILHGRLDNGLAYYVRKNAKPKERAALALAVKIGSLAEEENERGVAHIVEHLAFSATSRYSNHDIVRFLESIGAEFGACQNAYTSADETVFELLAPVDKEELLQQAVSVLSEFATEIRVAEEDVEKERGAVLEEWRERRNATGRMQEAYWQLLMKGSKYADRLPIGLESVIRGVPASTVKGFYRRWYHPSRMAVVAVGDFPDAQAVVDLIRKEFGHKKPPGTSVAATSAVPAGKEADVAEDMAVDAEREGSVLEGEGRVSRESFQSASADFQGNGGVNGEVKEDGVAGEEKGMSGGGDSEGVKEPFVAHSEPRFSTFVDREAGGSAVMISCKVPFADMVTINDYRQYLVEELFQLALSHRLFKLSRSPSPPFYSASASVESLVRSTRSFTLTASCKDRGTLAALEALWTESARVQLHGFSDRELAVVKAQFLSEMESAYVEREQTYSDALRDEYLQHFLRGEPSPGIEYEAQLAKTLLPEIHASEVSAVASHLSASNSCVVKIVESRVNATVDSISAVFDRVAASLAATRQTLPTTARDSGNKTGDELKEMNGYEPMEVSQNSTNGKGVTLIEPWASEDIPDKIVAIPPEPGHIVEQKEYPSIGTTEVLLSNGMRVSFKPTDFLDDQVLISGYAYGGLSEIPAREYHTAAMAQTVASEVGIFGFKPTVLSEMLAGKRIDCSAKISSYMRVFSGEVSPFDLEPGMQLLYQLFTSQMPVSASDIAVIKQMTREAVRAQRRDPFTAFSNRVRELNYGGSYFFRPVTESDLRKVDYFAACDYFHKCFRDPSVFTAVIVGNFKTEALIPLVLQYLGGIPRPDASESLPVYERDALSPLPFQFPKKTIREAVERVMVEAQGSTQITFPVAIPPGPDIVDEVLRVSFVTKLLETRIMQLLRFKHGHIYSVSVTSFLGGNRPSRQTGVRGDLAVAFSCDPDTSSSIIDLTLEEVKKLQAEGPSDADVATAKELEQRTYEMGLQENTFWLDRILRAYQSRLFQGDLAETQNKLEDTRLSVIADLSPASMRSALQRLLPSPADSQYTAVSLVPLAPLWRRILSLPPKRRRGLTTESMAAITVASAIVILAVAWNMHRTSS